MRLAVLAPKFQQIAGAGTCKCEYTVARYSLHPVRVRRIHLPRRILLAMACLLPLSQLFGPAAGAPLVHATSRDTTGALARLFELAQKHHIAAGCRPWERDTRLDRAAQLHAEEIAHRKRVSHMDQDGASVRERLHRQGYPADRATESIALYPTPEASVRFWMGEPPSGPHRRNITWCQYTAAGVGVAYDGRGVPWWVMDYANPTGG